ncbi:MAG: hypothetical protein EAZ92_08550 [Candidatus Kapaibacterium sp.]|nr:MAG: hypothetical protein EAZ92_08550 [Candidatus Kapabacteria bacterium]
MHQRILLLLVCCVIWQPAMTLAQTPKLSNQQIQALYERANAFMQQQKFAEALQDFNTLVQALPTNEMVLIGRAAVNLELSRPEASVRDMDKAISLNKKNPQPYFVRGLAYLRLKRHDASIADFEYVLKITPKNTDAHYNCGVMYVQKGNIEKAFYHINTALKLEPKYLPALEARNFLYTQTGRTQEAEGDLQAILQIEPNNYNALHNLGQVYLLTKKFDKAKAVIQKKIQLRPNEPLERILLGSIALRTQAFQEAIEQFTDVLAKDPSNIKARGFRAEAYFRNTQYAEAVKDCNIFFTDNPSDVSITNQMGSLLDLSVSSVSLGVSVHSHAVMFVIRGLSTMMLGQTAWQNDIQKAGVLGIPEANILAFAQGFTSLKEMLNTDFRTKTTLCLHPEYWKFPHNLQFYPRATNDSAQVPLQGTIAHTGYDSVYVRVFKNAVLMRRFAEALRYENINDSVRRAPFSLSTNIHAEKALYRFELGVKNAQRDTLLAVRDSIVCGDAFMVSGQSNAIFGAEYTAHESEYLRSFSINTSETFWTMPPTTRNTLASALMENLLQRSAVPIALINGAFNGSKIENHYSSAKNDTNDPFTLGGQLKIMLEYSGMKAAARGMMWYQGEADVAAKYAEKFDSLRTMWKAHYPALQKIYAVQIRPSACGQSTQHLLRDAQGRFPVRYADVEVIAASAPIPAHDGCHYGNAGYIALGKQLSALVARDFYRSPDTLGISSPRLLKAAWTNASRNEIALTFATNDALICGADTSIGGKIRSLAQDGFLLDEKPAKAVSVRSEKNMVFVKFASAQQAKTISYIPEKCYAASDNAPCTVYEGPWLATPRGVGALTFADAAIQ